MMNNFPENPLWERPAGVASPAFHIQHLTGVHDRVFTYARKESLTTAQLQGAQYGRQSKGNKISDERIN